MNELEDLLLKKWQEIFLLFLRVHSRKGDRQDDIECCKSIMGEAQADRDT